MVTKIIKAVKDASTDKIYIAVDREYKTMFKLCRLKEAFYWSCLGNTNDNLRIGDTEFSDEPTVMLNLALKDFDVFMLDDVCEFEVFINYILRE